MSLDPQEELRLIAALRQGDDQAMNRIMESWESPLMAFAWRYVQNSADARDLVAECFVRLYQQREKLRSDTKLSSWLFTVLSNLCNNQHRWRRRHPTVSMDAPDENTGLTLGDRTPGEHIHPGERMERDERVEALRQAIERLPHDLKTTLLLYHYEHLSYREIAQVLGCSERGVETRLYRAKQRLREELEPDDDDSPGAVFAGDPHGSTS